MDSVIYCNDLIALKAKLTEDGYYDEESNSYSVNHTLTPIVKNGNKTLSYVRDMALDLTEYPMLENLGSYDDIEGDAAKLATYKSVYDYEAIIEFTDEDGDIHTQSKPFKIGEFA